MSKYLIIYPSSSMGNFENTRKVEKAKALAENNSFDLILYSNIFSFRTDFFFDPIQHLFRRSAHKLEAFNQTRHSLDFACRILERYNTSQDQFYMIIAWYQIVRLWLYLIILRKKIKLIPVYPPLSANLVFNLIMEIVKIPLLPPLLIILLIGNKINNSIMQLLK